MPTPASVLSGRAPRRSPAQVGAVLLAALLGCGGGSSPGGTSAPDQRGAAAPAVGALRAGRFADARARADRGLAADRTSSVARMAEIDRAGGESLERKLRYLLWLN